MKIRRSRAAAAATSILLALGTVASALTVVTTANAADPLPNGQTSFTAAASCWEIKQNYPSSPTGVYWLVTPTLKAPEQFYCDMTTNGGGWVLVGRGREGWKEQYEGQGSPAQLRSVVTGPEAFNTVQLPSTTIDGLLDGGRVDALQDDIRLRRARNSTGTQWQEARFNFTRRDRWVWTFSAEHRVSNYSFDGLPGLSSGGTASFGSDQQYRRVITTSTAAQGWTRGWAYGSSVTGANNASTYIWSNSSSTGEARPFTQVYLRPRLRLADLAFPAIPNSGAPADERAPLVENGALPAPWGVTGLANGQTGELDTEVAAFAQVGNRMFVGGNFRYVQQGAGGQQISQPYLAAFDVNTGAWLSDFRPQLNGQVKALAALPGGRLAVGGEFGVVNGRSSPALVALNTTTGATATNWDVQLENRISGGVLAVRGLSVRDGWLYLGGAFTHVAGGTRDVPVYARSGARVSTADGTPDPNWNPAFSGTVVAVDASNDGSRLYAAGYFASSNGQPANRAAAVRTVAGAPLATPAWTPTWSSGERANYQQAIVDSGQRVWVGGSEHSMFSYDINSFQRLSGNITKAGGDFQTAAAFNGVVYGGCHCNDWNYSNAFTWSNVGTNWTQADKIGFMGAWDAATGAYLPEFNPVMRARNGLGSWAIYGDSNGAMWTGGSFTSAINRNGSNQWVGGFARYAQRDAKAPPPPSSLTGRQVGSQVSLTWQPSSEAGVRYEVIRGNRVVATTATTTLQVPAADATRYFVRAVDAAGNRSATTPVFDANAPSPVVVAPGSEWSWRFDGAALPASWNTAGFNDSAWASDPAVLGFGSSLVASDIDVPAGSTRPLTAYFRHKFTVDSLTGVGSFSLRTVADDGVVVYVNGVEVGRANMPAGPVGPNTYSTAGPRSTTAAANPVTFTVPASLVNAGVNVVAAEVHLGWRSTPDVSFDLSIEKSDEAVPPPAAPVVEAVAEDETSVRIAWQNADDATAYRITRAGADPVEAPAADGSHLVEGLAPNTSYTWQVTALDRFGRSSAAVNVSAQTPSAPPEPAGPIVAAGSEWSWIYDGSALPTSWNAVGFDDAAWASDPAVLGFGSSLVATDIDVPSGTTRPLAAFFRREFTLDEVGGDLTLETVADDGVVVYVNGVEVGRANMPAGPITPNTYPTAGPRSTTAAANPVTFTVPQSLLNDGENVVAAQVHLGWRATPDVSFDLTLEQAP